jgi:hypothetical protein
MNDRNLRRIALASMVGLLLIFAAPLFSATKNWALVVPPGSKLVDLSLADLVKFCNGKTKAWPDGKNFTIVMHNPESPDMHGVVQKLFGASPDEAKALVTKLNEGHVVVKVVDSDEDLMRTVGATPGAIGVIDVYAINSSVKVLRLDGKLPFDPGYGLKGN